MNWSSPNQSAPRRCQLEPRDEWIRRTLAIAGQGDAINVKSVGREGGRGIRRLIAELVENRLQIAAIWSKREYSGSRTIRLTVPEMHAVGSTSGDRDNIVDSDGGVVRGMAL
jgi:hypothetical protein